MHNEVRFSRDKRFFQRITYLEFLQAAVSMIALVQRYRPDAAIHIFTCEDRTTYNYSTVTFLDDSIIEAMKERKSYQLKELTEEVWGKSYSIDLSINGQPQGEDDSFAIHVEVDRTASPRRMFFFSIGSTRAMDEAILAAFRRRSFLYGIGDGYHDVSDFNLAFGKRITGLTF